MKYYAPAHASRAEHRAAPKPAHIPSGDQVRYSAPEGQS